MAKARKQHTNLAAATDGDAPAPATWYARQDLRYLVTLLLLVALLFTYTVAIRRPFFGQMSMEHHHWLTADCMRFTRQWYLDGAWNMRYLLVINPPSIEFPTIASRGVYGSYPCGAIVPIYLISKVLGQEPNPAIIMGWNLVNHLLIALCLALIAWVLLRQLAMPPLAAMLFALLPPGVELLMPSPLYFHQNVYWADQAIILPVALLLLLEVLRDGGLSPRGLRVVTIAQTVLCFIGAFTDWFIYPFAIILYGKRLACGQISRTNVRALLVGSLAFWAPMALALGIFISQITAAHALDGLLEKFLIRTATNREGANYMMNGVSFFQRFWAGHIQSGFGPLATPLLWGCLFFLACVLTIAYVRRRTQPLSPPMVRLLSLMALTLLPCFLHTYLLRNHSYIHDFSALKFSLPLALMPCVLLPVWGCYQAGVFTWNAGRQRAVLAARHASVPSIIAVCAVMLTMLYLLPTHRGFSASTWDFLMSAGLKSMTSEPMHRGYIAFFDLPYQNFYALERYFQTHYTYNDVVYSKQIQIDNVPPQFIAFSMKRVYKVSSDADIANLVKGIHGDYHLKEFEPSFADQHP